MTDDEKRSNKQNLTDLYSTRAYTRQKTKKRQTKQEDEDRKMKTQGQKDESKKFESYLSPRWNF